MARTLTNDEISDLTVAERIDLIETLWDSIDPNQLSLPESHRRALDEALADYRRAPDEGRSWDDVRNDLFPRR
jgi:putative addiction module component (TIGR02574 family)